MKALTIKMLRDLLRLWPQALAIALVMAAGVATLILGIGAYESLSATRQSYYDENRFADIFVNLKQAPLSLQRDILALPGVVAVDARITKLALADMPGMNEPASVMLVSFPDDGREALNRIHLRSGRLPTPASDEVLVSVPFAQAHHLREGDHVAVLLNGRLRNMRISGTALSPEFIYALAPGFLMPDDRRFGILWMPYARLAAAYNLEGSFNSASVKLGAAKDYNSVVTGLDALTENWGGHGAFGQKDQQSHAFLNSELNQLRAMSRILPPIFLFVSAYLVHMTLSRLIALEREQIGLLKAIGYSRLAIASHYASFAIVIAAVGVLIGSIMGTWLGMKLTELYGRFFSFPFLLFTRNPTIYGIAAGATVAFALAGAIMSVHRASAVSPAVAMLPPAPARFDHFSGAFLKLTSHLRQSSKIILRHLAHSPWRTAAGIAGIALAVAILVGSLWSFGSIDHMIRTNFERSERQDASVYFAKPQPSAALHELARLPGVLQAEPFRVEAVKLRHGPVERRVNLVGRAQNSTLTQMLDEDQKPLRIPDAGVALSGALAQILKIRTGDQIEVEFLEGRRVSFLLPVSAIVSGDVGLSAFIDMSLLNRILLEPSVASGAYLKLDPAKSADLFAALKATPAVASISLQYAALQKFREIIRQNIVIMISVYASLASIIAFGVVYNFARISLSEQGREMASLRVLGFTRAEVSTLLIGELFVVLLLAQPVGWALGFGFAKLMAEGFRSELYRVPLVVNREVYAWSSLVVFSAAAISALLVRRRIDQLDMIEVLKTRE